MNQPSVTLLTYTIDHQDRICSVTGEWDRFARENGVAQLTVETTIGRPLWSFIGGAETTHLYELIVNHVRTTRSAISFPFRCDAPDRRRFMGMTVSSPDGREVVFSSQVLREEPREALAILDPASPHRAVPFIRICSWCKRVLVAEAAWRELEEAIVRLDLFNDSPPPQFTHGLCPDCEQTIQDSLNDPQS